MARPGVCDYTTPPARGDCAAGSSGSFGPGLQLDQCIQHCHACERCRFVSHQARACNWYAACRAALYRSAVDAVTVRIRACETSPRCTGRFKWKDDHGWCSSRCAKVAVLLSGEAFRANTDSGDRTLGTQGGLEGQRIASASHIAYLLTHERFEHVDLFVDTTTTAHDGWLAATYAKWLQPGSLRLRNATKLAFPAVPTFPGAVYGGAYDGLLVLRPDMVLKPALAAALTHADLSSVNFPFEVFSCPVRPMAHEVTPFGRPRVADGMLWVPRKWLKPSLGIERWFRNHDAMDAITSSGNVRVRLLLGEQHNSNPLYDNNPIYSLAARSEIAAGELRHGYEGIFHQEQRECWDRKLRAASNRTSRFS